MKHSAKKTKYGNYEYRGYIIENNGECWVIGSGEAHNMTALDAEDTKRAAMAKIDNWLA